MITKYCTVNLPPIGYNYAVAFTHFGGYVLLSIIHIWSMKTILKSRFSTTNVNNLFFFIEIAVFKLLSKLTSKLIKSPDV